MKERSRLTKRLVRQSERNLAFSMVGIIAVLVALVLFGIPFLGNVAMIFSRNQAKDEVQQKKMAEFIPIPSLDIPFSATNSAQISVSGISHKDYRVKLYINGDIIDTNSVDEDNTFLFRDVPLTEGENGIQAQAITKDKKESDLSNKIIVVYKHKEPLLSINFPSNGQNFGKEESTINVSGKTDPGIKVTVNGFWAIVDWEGKFSYNLPVKGGENTITIVATDEAGNKKQEERKVTKDQ